MEGFYETVRSLWVVWLMIIFVGIVAWAFWPSRRQQRKMDDHAQIPLRDDDRARDDEDERS
jgi:cytochrome c oxidase cbb3-type subunit 4